MRIAVVIASRNSVGTLKNALESVNAQTFAATEVWVIDDASSDDTQGFLTHYKIQNPRLNSEHLESSRGPGGARNKILSRLNADWILPLDADDRLIPSALASFASCAEHHQADVYYGHIVEIKGNLRTCVSYPQIQPGTRGIRTLLSRPRIPFKHSACLIRLSALSALSGYDESLEMKSDVDLMLRMLASHRVFKAVHEPVLEHFIHPLQMSIKRFRGIASYYSIIRRLEMPFIQKLSCLIQRIFWECVKALVRR